MNKFKGIVAVILSAVIYGSVPLLARSVYALGGNPVALIFYRSLIALPLLYVLAKKSNIDTMSLNLETFKKILTLVFLGYASTAFLLYASYLFIPTGIATTLHFSYPIFVVLGYLVFFREKPGKTVILALLMSFSGILLFNDNKAPIDLLGFTMALGSGMTFAFFIIYVKKSGLNQMNLMKFTFYLALFTGIIYFLLGQLTGTLLIVLDYRGWLLVASMSLLVSLGAVFLFQVGIRIVGPQRTAILSTFEPLTSIIIGTLAFEEALNLRIILGMLLILLAVVMITLDENKKNSGV